MGGDYTRFTFDPRRHHAGVLLQQGRVQLDADLNELVEIVDRHERAQMYDLVGRSGVPRLSTPDGFRIRLASGVYTIGRGRIYVDGVLADNHGTSGPEEDVVLDELRGSADTPFNDQPYLGTAKPAAQLDGAGPHLVYVDVWRRELTAVERPAIVEKAVGVDTSTRVQTAWQVRVLRDLPQGATCATDLSTLPAWQQATRRSGARLTTEAVQPPAPDDPCLVAAVGGYRGRENRLYRVEVHDDGTQTGRPLTLKWSRDNASVAARVSSIEAGDRVLHVERVGRDRVMRFATDQWVEVTDDERELDGKPGIPARVQSVNEVDGTVTLVGPAAGINVARNARLRRWDQTQNLTTEGLIQPPSLPATVALEDGVRVKLELVGGGNARVGDYWLFAARTADASVELLQQAPPRGTHHHYAPLAVVRGDDIEDCRTLFPPEEQEESCDCTVCVSAEEQQADPDALQRAIESVREKGGKVCLEAGVYPLKQPLRVRAARSVKIVGKGYRSILLYGGQGAGVVVESSRDVTLAELSVVGRRGGSVDDTGGRLADVGIAVLNTLRTRIDRCYVVQDVLLIAQGLIAGAQASGTDGIETLAGRAMPGGQAIGLGGMVGDTAIRDCILVGEIGVGSLTGGRSNRVEGSPSSKRLVDYDNIEGSRGYLVTLGLVVVDNLMVCARSGVDLGTVDRRLTFAEGGDRVSTLTASAGETRIEGNEIYGCVQAGISALGRVVPAAGPTLEGPVTTVELQLPLGGRLDVRGNLLVVAGDGIVVRGDETRVVNNDVSGLVRAGRSGIIVNPAVSRSPVRGCLVGGNRVRRMPAGAGVELAGPADDLRVEGNVIEETGLGGIMTSGRSRAGNLIVAHNEVHDVGAVAGGEEGFAAGIAIHGAEAVDVSHNLVRGVATESADEIERIGIRAVACERIRITSNQVHDIATTEEFGGSAKGIEIVGEWDRLDVLDNSVQAPLESAESSRWYALSISSVVESERIVGDVLRKRTFRLAADASDEERAIAGTLRGFNRGTPVIAFPASTGATIHVFTEWSVEPVELGRSVTAVSGNLLDARGRSEAVFVLTRGNLSFQDNRCLLSAAEPKSPVAHVQGEGAVIVNANHVEGPPRISVALTIRAGQPAQGQVPHATVLGNIVTGPIELNGNPLQNPWGDLNLSV